MLLANNSDCSDNMSMRKRLAIEKPSLSWKTILECHIKITHALADNVVSVQK